MFVHHHLLGGAIHRRFGVWHHSVGYLCVLLLSIGAQLASGAIDEPIAVEGGLITGTPSWGNGVRMFRGIPFAAPPVGDNRFRPPQHVIPWEGVRACDHFGASPVQRTLPMYTAAWNDGTTPKNEDCLYLNVWTPATSVNDQLPVMVWIYGGGGTGGSGSEALYDPNGLCKKGVVAVSFNYRVNVFGWLAHPELTKESPHHSSGNYGALDQVAALRWVHNNIARFGGDPNCVTIFGESGGSRSVNWLMASPLAKGLFHRAIGESHTVFGPMSKLAQAEASGLKFAQGAGAATLADLRAMSADELLSAFLRNPAGLNVTIVDGWLLRDEIQSIFANGQQNDVPLLTGGTNDETGRIVGDVSRGNGPETLSAFQLWARATFGDGADEFMKLYPATSDAEVRRAWHDVTRDANMAGHHTWVKLQTATGRSPAWLYLFSQSVPFYASDGTSAVRRGSAHGSEIMYVFDNLRYADRPWGQNDRQVADMLSSYWTNFAKTGDPNGSGLPVWPKYDSSAPRLLNIADGAKAETYNAGGLEFLSSRTSGRRSE